MTHLRALYTRLRAFIARLLAGDPRGGGWDNYGD
jgi:hypothetical protein